MSKGEIIIDDDVIGNEFFETKKRESDKKNHPLVAIPTEPQKQSWEDFIFYTKNSEKG